MTTVGRPSSDYQQCHNSEQNGPPPSKDRHCRRRRGRSELVCFRRRRVAADFIAGSECVYLCHFLKTCCFTTTAQVHRRVMFVCFNCRTFRLHDGSRV